MLRGMADGASWSEIEQKKSQSVGQLLMKCGRLVDECALARVNTAEDAPAIRIRPAHTRLFPHIDTGGTRLSDLAARVGVSKQAVGQLVEELAGLGVLEVAPHPTDGRARLVRFTPQGMRAIGQGLQVLGGIEAEIQGEIGKERMQRLHETLLDVVQLLEKLRADLER